MAAEFKVGAEVVCIKTHSQHEINGVVKGTKYQVQSIRTWRCGCYSSLLLDIGIATESGRPTVCDTCKSNLDNSDVWWVNAALFAPLDELESQQAIDELLDKILESEKEKV